VNGQVDGLDTERSVPVVERGCVCFGAEVNRTSNVALICSVKMYGLL
jgi:hypothetical protein